MFREQCRDVMVGPNLDASPSLSATGRGAERHCARRLRRPDLSPLQHEAGPRARHQLLAHRVSDASVDPTSPITDRVEHRETRRHQGEK